MKRRTIVGLAGNATASASSGVNIPFADSARSFTPTQSVLTYRITDTAQDLAEEQAYSTVGNIYDAANNQYWKHTGTWVVDAAPIALLDGRTYQNPRTKKLFYADSSTSVRALTVGTSDVQTELPLPDVWVPFKDSGEIKIGPGTPDTVSVGGNTFQLKTKSVSFTRVTTGTYIDTKGVLQTAPINTPRFEAEGLLQEGGSTNYIPNSTGNPWRGTSVTTLTPTSVTSPDGTTNGVVRFAALGGTGIFGTAISAPIGSLTSGGYCAWSVFAKADTYDLIQLRWLGGTSGVTNRYLNVNLTTGEIGAHTLAYAKMIPMANGWWRILAVTQIDGDLTGNTSAEPGIEFISSLTDGRRPSITLDADKAVFLFGPQMEVGKVASSYIPTSSATATRDRDIWGLLPVNTGYTTLKDSFARTAVMTVSLNQAGYVNTPSATYSEMLRSHGPAYDILWRLQSSSSTGKPYVAAFRGTGNMFVNLPDTFSEQPFIHRISGNTVTLGALDTLTTKTDWVPQVADGAITAFQSTTQNAPVFVYHIKNLRIWHRALTDQQLALLQRGL